MRFPIPQPFLDNITYFKTNLRLENVPSFAKTDYSLIIDFLDQYSGNLATFESYRREVERLLQWAWLIAKKSLLNLQRQDIENYLSFCLNPPLSWISIKRATRFIDKNGQREINHAWRPFVATVTKAAHKEGLNPDKKKYLLSQKAIREIFTVLGSFYHYLVLQDKISLNPIQLIRQKNRYLQKRQTASAVKRLTEKQWLYCLQTAKKLAEEDSIKHERTLFIITALYLLYLRISELSATSRWIPQMSHFYQDSQLNWWFKTVGKGNKVRDIAVSDAMLNALIRYRKSLLLSDLPLPNDTTPLLCKEKGKGPMQSPRHIRRIVQTCFDAAMENLKNDGLMTEANALAIATVHWLRHTGISDDINKRGRPVAHVRDDAGHSSSAITDRYNDIELLARHQSAKQKDPSLTE